MRTKFVSLAASLAALVTLGTTQLAQASSHREAPGTSKDPVADNTDVWAWNEGTAAAGTLHVVVSYNPFEEPSGGPNFHTFGDDVLYEIHVARGSKGLDDIATYQIRFTTTPGPVVDVTDLTKPPGGGKEFFSQLSGASQSYSVTQVIGGTATVLVPSAKVAPPNIGPQTNKVAYGLTDTTKAGYEAFVLGTDFVKTFGTGGKVWAGPRDDGFYVDLGGVFDLANLRAKGAAQDGVSGYNAHTIALEIPTANLPAAAADDKFGTRFGVWASASRRKMSVRRNDGSVQSFGPWVQVSRLGLPLVNEAVIGLQDKDKYNRTLPKDDVANFGGYILNPIVVRDAEAVGIYKALNVPDATVTTLKSNRLDIITAINVLSDPTAADGFPLASTGDVLRVEFGDGTAKPGFPNGRPLGPKYNGGAANKENDVTDTILTLALAGAANLLSTDPSAIKVKDNVDSNDANYTDTFPYLPTPWTGYNEGHGKVNP